MPRKDLRELSTDRLSTYLPLTVAELRKLQSSSSLQLTPGELEDVVQRTSGFLQQYSVDEGTAHYVRQFAQLLVQFREARMHFPRLVSAMLDFFDTAITKGYTPEQMDLLDAKVAGGIMGIYFAVTKQQQRQPAAEKQIPANGTPVKAASRFKNLESICNLGYRIGSIELIDEALRITFDEPESGLDAESVSQDFLAATQQFCRLRVGYHGRTVTLSPLDDNRSRGRALRFLEAYRDALAATAKA